MIDPINEAITQIFHSIIQEVGVYANLVVLDMFNGVCQKFVEATGEYTDTVSRHCDDFRDTVDRFIDSGCK